MAGLRRGREFRETGRHGLATTTTNGNGDETVKGEGTGLGPLAPPGAHTPATVTATPRADMIAIEVGRLPVEPVDIMVRTISRLAPDVNHANHVVNPQAAGIYRTMTSADRAGTTNLGIQNHAQTQGPVHVHPSQNAQMTCDPRRENALVHLARMKHVPTIAVAGRLHLLILLNAKLSSAESCCLRGKRTRQ